MKKRITIKKINIGDEYMQMIDENNEEYYLEIVNGSIDCNIVTESGKDVGIQYIDENDFVKIRYHEENKKYIVKKIKINDKYDFLSDSSDEDIDLIF